MVEVVCVCVFFYYMLAYESVNVVYFFIHQSIAFSRVTEWLKNNIANESGKENKPYHLYIPKIPIEIIE